MALNPTNIKPVKYGVLVKPDDTDQKKGSIWLPPNTLDRQQEQQDEGILIAKGSMAFSDWVGEPIPQLGDHVVFKKYAGSIYQRLDTREKYRLMNDDDICAVLEETGNGAGVTARD